MIKGIHHVGISVSSLDRAIEFYTQALAMELLSPAFSFGGPQYEQVMGLGGARGRMCVLRRDSLQLELFEFAHPTPARQNPDYPVADIGLSHFGVEVTDIDRTYERLHSAGVRFHSPVVTFPRGVKATYARDPDGNVFELLEMPIRPGA
jgi:catechol 2,3-dioxygenase-like lactoylglutathione lyase family enzyme